MDNHKFHFFIGNILNDELQINILRKLQKKLRKKYILRYPHWNTKFFANMLYIGYRTNEEAADIMNRSIKQLLTALSEKFLSFDCSYTGYKIEYDKSFYKISLTYEDKNNYLENIVIPYLNEHDEYKESNIKPLIDLIYYKSSVKLDSKREINIQIPENTFKIDHISLIRGVPVKNRAGKPSVHDQMNLEEIQQYTFPLQ
jgi:hypothetical protein